MAENIVILTGAGISAESGINTFRARDGLWESHRLEAVATPAAFKANPDFVLDFYNQRRAQILSPAIQPNAAHRALAHLERNYNRGEVFLVTQNIDNLHERGGSHRVVHMHGEILKMRCQKTEKIYQINNHLTSQDLCPCCEQAGQLRPHIVWFGEMPFYMDEIYEALSQAHIFISIGTSGQVYPAAAFVEMASQAGAHCIEVNLEPTGNRYFDRAELGKASEKVPALVEKILSGNHQAAMG